MSKPNGARAGRPPGEAGAPDGGGVTSATSLHDEHAAVVGALESGPRHREPVGLPWSSKQRPRSDPRSRHQRCRRRPSGAAPRRRRRGVAPTGRESAYAKNDGRERPRARRAGGVRRARRRAAAAALGDQPSRPRSRATPRKAEALQLEDRRAPQPLDVASASSRSGALADSRGRRANYRARCGVMRVPHPTIRASQTGRPSAYAMSNQNWAPCRGGRRGTPSPRPRRGGGTAAHDAARDRRLGDGRARRQHHYRPSTAGTTGLAHHRVHLELGVGGRRGVEERLEQRKPPPRGCRGTRGDAERRRRRRTRRRRVELPDAREILPRRA